MPNVGIEEVQTWLPLDKFELGELDADLEASVTGKVLGHLAIAYDVSEWVAPESTPALVRTVIAMRVAAWLYSRAVAEDAGMDSYSGKLLQGADELLEAIMGGLVYIGQDPDLGLVRARTLSFFPTDAEEDSRMFNVERTF